VNRFDIDGGRGYQRHIAPDAAHVVAGGQLTARPMDRELVTPGDGAARVRDTQGQFLLAARPNLFGEVHLKGGVSLQVIAHQFLVEEHFGAQAHRLEAEPYNAALPIFGDEQRAPLPGNAMVARPGKRPCARNLK